MYPSNAHSRTSKNKNSSKKQRRNGEFTLYIPPSVGIMPDRLKTTLKWWKSDPINLLSSTWSSIRIQANAAFDPDPTSGATVPSGFTQLAAIYTSYRVKSGRIRVEIINPDPAIPVTVCVLPVNLDPGSAPSSNYVISSLQQPYAVKGLVSTQGSPPLILSNQISTKKIFGNPMTDFDDNFSALTTANPNNLWFWIITFYAPAIHTVSAVIVNYFVEMDVEFYDRKVLSNVAPAIQNAPLGNRVPSK